MAADHLATEATKQKRCPAESTVKVTVGAAPNFLKQLQGFKAEMMEASGDCYRIHRADVLVRPMQPRGARNFDSAQGEALELPPCLQRDISSTMITNQVPS